MPTVLRVAHSDLTDSFGVPLGPYIAGTAHMLPSEHPVERVGQVLMNHNTSMTPSPYFDGFEFEDRIPSELYCAFSDKVQMTNWFRDADRDASVYGLMREAGFKLWTYRLESHQIRRGWSQVMVPLRKARLVRVDSI